MFAENIGLLTLRKIPLVLSLHQRPALCGLWSFGSSSRKLNLLRSSLPYRDDQNAQSTTSYSHFPHLPRLQCIIELMEILRDFGYPLRPYELVNLHNLFHLQIQYCYPVRQMFTHTYILMIDTESHDTTDATDFSPRRQPPA